MLPCTLSFFFMIAPKKSCQSQEKKTGENKKRYHVRSHFFYYCPQKIMSVSGKKRQEKKLGLYHECSHLFS